MLGLVTEPGVAHSTHVADVSEPADEGVQGGMDVEHA